LPCALNNNNIYFIKDSSGSNTKSNSSTVRICRQATDILCYRGTAIACISTGGAGGKGSQAIPQTITFVSNGTNVWFANRN
jgi:hypothetical protein